VKSNGKKPPKNYLSIKTKMEVIENLDKELSGREIAEIYGITEPTISKIKKGKERIRQFSTSAIKMALQKYAFKRATNEILEEIFEERNTKNLCYGTE